MNCPNCSSPIRSEDINVQTDIARCYHCGNLFRISEQVPSHDKLDADVPSNFNIRQAPEHCYYENDGQTLTIGASAKSKMAYFLIPFAIGWSSLTIGGIYGDQLTGEFSLLLSLFGLPFLAGAAMLFAFCLFFVKGRVELRLTRQGGEIFTGAFQWGYRQQFKWSEIDRVFEETNRHRKSRNNQSTQIVLEGSHRLSFGGMILDDRRFYLFNALKVTLEKEKRGKSIF